MIQTIEAAKAKAESVHADGAVATTSPKAYNQAIETLSSSISACVGAGLLSKTMDVVKDARKLETRMRKKLNKVLENIKRALRDAIRTAEQTRESGPLSACLDQLSKGDDLVRQSCGDLAKDAQKLLDHLNVCSF